MLKEMYNAYLTTIQMLKDRDYDIPEHYNDITFMLFKELYNNDKLDIYLKTGDKSVFVKILFINKIHASKLENYIKQINEHYSPKYMIFVGPLNATDSIINLLEKYNNVQLFNSKKLQINITKHEFVPKHIKLDDNKKIEITEKYSLESFPIIQISDPVVQYYNFQRGDIIKIIRSNLNSGYSEYYRLVS